MLKAYIREAYPIPQNLSGEIKEYVDRLEELYVILNNMSDKVSDEDPEYMSLLWEYEDKQQWLGIMAKTKEGISQEDFDALYFRYYIS
ncbi:MAG: hypothetical protein KH813_00245 [Negativicoccus succinicivorans]|uniref:hypothetical protein n=1 Tax=Negativicoccus succinicivorans TaxID=620903 RepID=UPI0026EE2E27|nr:hypothetical protein [Negativicoccus succinicivorans]MBS6027838.1 hypothetical protein [Negativicoccus succinicivorans]